MARRWVMALSGVFALTVAACTPLPQTGPLGEGPWTWTEISVGGPSRTQGLATDDNDAVPGDTWYTSQFTLERADGFGNTLNSVGSLPADVFLVWKNSHTGDPDAHAGRVIVPWENKQLGPSDPPTKSWGVYDGASLNLIGWSKHVLGAGETNDNPWVAISPDGGFIVTGHYSPLLHLEVYPVPVEPFADVPMVATIPLDQPAYDVQGCDFANATRLVCASDDLGTSKQAFVLDLDAAVTSATGAHLTYEGPLPQAPPLILSPGTCGPSGEVEGIDAHHVVGVGTVVRALVIDRCLVVTHEYQHVIPD